MISVSSSRAVITTTGTELTARIIRSASYPLTSGRPRSSRIRSGGEASRCWSALMAVAMLVLAGLLLDEQGQGGTRPGGPPGVGQQRARDPRRGQHRVSPPVQLYELVQHLGAHSGTGTSVLGDAQA